MNDLAINEYYGTLSQTISALKKLGYTLDFNIHEECLACHKTNIQLSSDDFQIDKFYRFEGMSDPEDQSILYAISSPKFKVKGLLVNGYGVGSDEYSSKLINKLNTHQSQNARKNSESSLREPDAKNLLLESPIEINIQSLISKIKNENTWANKDLNSITIYKSNNMRIVLMGLHKNAQLKPHSAKGVISLQVISGEIVFTANEKSVKLEKDQMIALSEGVTHSVVAIKESFLLLTLAMTN